MNSLISVKHFDINHVGRDFVVGDLHGHKKLLDDLLLQVSFDYEVDRLFSVGDLCDRGPDSMGCINLLKEPWFYSVLGNHEEMLLYELKKNISYRTLFNPRIDGYIRTYGSEWILDYILPSGTVQLPLIDALDIIQKLPVIIVVGDDDSRFNIVHAALYAPERIDSIYSDMDIDTDFSQFSEDEIDAAYSRILGGRQLSRVYSAIREFPQQTPSLSPTYVGHDINKEIRRCLSHIYIDTGSYLSSSSIAQRADGYCLTLIEPKSGLTWVAN
jgi:serine/threonine protein phosphatase 1